MVSLTRFALGFAVFSAVSAPIASAQSAISAQSGLIHYTEGQVFVDGQLIEPKFGQFPQLKDHQELGTGDGRVEVLLTPGVFLRVGENSAMRMVSNRLSDTRLELVSGEAIVQVDELLKANSITVTYHDYAVTFPKAGIYRLTTEPTELRVYGGEASVDLKGQAKVVKEDRRLVMDGELRETKFDKNEVDDLYKWSRRRSEYIAMANVTAAKTLFDSGMYGLPYPGGIWIWNPYLGMYTFVPSYGTFFDPWGFAYWSPFTVDTYLGGWPGYVYPVSTGGGGSGSGSKPAHHPPPRIRPTPGHGRGSERVVPRGVTVAAVAHRTVVTAGGGGHAAGAFGNAGSAGFSGGGSGRSGGSSFSGGGSSAAFSGSSAHSSGGGGGSSGGGAGSHK